jgi:hypothetical protein
MILIECQPDEFIVKRFGFRNVKHANGQGNVINGIEKRPGVTGIVDDDPGKSHVSKRENYIEKECKSTIKLLVKNDDETKRIILWSPDVEGWILHRAKLNKVSPKKYHLPDDGTELHKIPHIEEKKDFLDFIDELIEKKDEEIEILKTWLKGY